MRSVGVVMLVLGLVGLGGSSLLSSLATSRRPSVSPEELAEARTEAWQAREHYHKLLMSEEAADAELNEALGRVDRADERLEALDHAEGPKPRLVDSVAKVGFWLWPLIPAALPLLLGSFMRVGRSLRPQNRLARHPFLAVLAASLVLGGVIVAALGILTLSSGQFSELPATRFFGILFFFIATPLAATFAGAAMLAALFRPWDRDDVG